MFFIFLLFQTAFADLIHEHYDTPENLLENDNIFISSMWALSLCSCIGVVCDMKKKLPKIKPVEDYDKYFDKKNYLELTIEENQLQKFKKDIEQVKKAINYIEKQNNQGKINQLNQENNIETNIPYFIQNKFGNGIIKYKEGKKYYHGIGFNDNKKNIKSRMYTFKKRIDGNKFKYTDFTTINHNEYCSNCSLDTENSKRKRVYEIYKCNGHFI